MEYLTLFTICFLAATLLPLGSEVTVAGMAAAEKNFWVIWIVASLGNYLGAFANYAVGRWGGKWCLRRYFDTSPAALEKARRWYSHWGHPTLFFAWLPVIGDPLTVLAGILNVHPLLFTLWVLPGKAIRYWIVIKGVEGILR